MRGSMTDYVVGFAFSRDLQQVLLVRKQRPAWQCGRYNGIGGHVEAGELPLEAMRREFFEETGIFTSLRDWRHFAVVHTEKSRVFVFSAVLDIEKAVTKTDEPIHAMTANQIASELTVPNLTWLVPLASRAGDLPVPAIVHETARYEAA